MISENIKQATRNSHAELEKLVIERIRLVKSAAGYLHLLEIFYGFFKPVEEKIAVYMDHNYLTDFYQRRKSTALLEDIEQTNLKSSGKLCNDLPEITGPSQSFGALYVLEGSTLGGGIICKLLKNKLGDDAPACFSFFNGYGEATQDMWMKFKDRLNNFSDDAAIQRQMIDAANDTFVKFKNWITLYERNSPEKL